MVSQCYRMSSRSKSRRRVRSFATGVALRLQSAPFASQHPQLSRHPLLKRQERVTAASYKRRLLRPRARCGPCFAGGCAAERSSRCPSPEVAPCSTAPRVRCAQPRTRAPPKNLRRNARERRPAHQGCAVAHKRRSRTTAQATEHSHALWKGAVSKRHVSYVSYSTAVRRRDKRKLEAVSQAGP